MSDTRTYRLLVEYDGGAFSGFQKQPNALTVQGALEAALAQITRQTTPVYGAGRTDAGVHATGQVVSFTTASRLPPEKLQRALNAVAGPHLAVRAIQQVPEGFHARHSALWRQYRYRLLLADSPSPLRQSTVHWPGYGPLDLEAMTAFWGSLLGRHDFTPWQNVGSDTGHGLCHVLTAHLETHGDELHFCIRADRFLYRMVRNLVGTALCIGRGWQSGAEAARMLATGEGKGGPAAPAKGLCFEAVGYELPWK